MGILDAPITPSSLGVVPKWKATTAYTAGDKVLAPNGDIVSAIATFTSGATYNAANWNASLALSTANFLADSTLTQKIKRKPDNLTWITTFPSGHTWTGATDINVSSTEVQFMGTQGVKYGPADPGTLRSLNSPTMAPIDFTGKQLVIAIKSSDDFAAGHTIYLADAAFTNYKSFGTDPANYRAADGWVYLSINPLGGSPVGTPNMAAVERIRININDPSGTHTEMIAAVGYAPIPATYPNGVVTIDFDDNATGQFELARPLMLAKGWPATIYSIGATADAKADGAMSTKDMHMLEDMFGWEIGAHSATSADHVSMNTLTDAQIEDSVLRVRQWMTTNKFKANGFAYPFGGNDARVRAVVSRYFSWGRIAGYNSSHATPPVTSGFFVAPTQFNTTAASITPLIDSAFARKQWLGLSFHTIVAGASSGGNMGSTDFATVLDYIQSKGMAVVTPSTLFGLNR